MGETVFAGSDKVHLTKNRKETKKNVGKREFIVLLL